MLTIDPKEVSIGKMHGYLQGAIVPRPIAFASTIDASGNINLSPFSFFNVFGTNPPTLVFSPSRRVRDNTIKHTLENVLEFPEVVINLVDYKIAEQMSLSSTEYQKGVNEFVKSGLTMQDSIKVKPPRVKESPVAFECIVKEVIPLGDQGGSGNLVVSEVVLAHFSERILDDEQRIDPAKIDLIARLGGDWYSRLIPESLFEIVKPLKNLGIGVDSLPEEIRNSKVLTGNDLGKLGNVEQLPDTGQIKEFASDIRVQKLKSDFSGDELTLKLHQLASELLADNKVEEAWKVLLQSN